MAKAATKKKAAAKSAAKSTSRKTREAESRTQGWVPPNKLATPPAPEGYIYRWVRYELLGEDQNSNVYSRTRQGYEPVHYQDLDDFETDHLEDGRYEGVVRSGDLILMKVPTEVAEARNDYFDGQAKKLQQAVDMELDNQDTHDSMPISKERASRVSRGTPRATQTFDED